MPDFDIMVVANRHREPLAARHLKGIPHEVSWTPDYPLPSGFRCRKEYVGLVDGAGGILARHHIGHNRCFRGHQDAARKAVTPIALIMEDDAVPNRPDWLDVAAAAAGLCGRFEVVSLHARGLERSCWIPITVERAGEFLVPAGKWRAPHAQFPMAWALGSLAYFMTREAREKLLAMSYDGYPMDLLIANRFSFCAISESPFDHGAGEKSLIG